VTLNDLKGHSSVAGIFKCNPSTIDTIFTVYKVNPKANDVNM